jgi:hypothetical protein
MPQDFYLRTQADPAITQILWVVPVYPAERAFAREQGYRALKPKLRWNTQDRRGRLSVRGARGGVLR